ncbi:hypothetical protein FRC19_005034 [Serendipita sp. 401]|nr:hypothetical protein FRC19_005034 [Serendipita sp. 401]
MEAPHSDASLGSQKAAPTDKVARLHLELARKWEEILKKIRSKPAFESFLKPKSFGKLDAAASDGPVVILNVQETRCDALVLIKGRIVSSVKHIHLERFSYQAAEKLLQQLKAALSSAGLRARSVRAHHWVKPKTDVSAGLRGILRTLWLDVVEPVLQGLEYKVELKKPPRIWWCPTGPLAFLPIHAAGQYDTASVGRKLSDYVVSSYTPTLTAILSEARIKAKSFKLLAVALPLTPYASSLPYTTNEIERIQKLTTKTSLVELTSESATVKRVVEEMKASDWVHLACHGEQVIEKAMKSGLLLHDKKLELSEMIKLSLPRAEFAFLSACQTATGDEKVAEESVHLASGMLFAGYRGLIATMWSINDKDAPQVAEDVYQRILKDGKPKREEAARALHDAVKRLREESKGDMLSWVPFIHIGR